VGREGEICTFPFLSTVTKASRITTRKNDWGLSSIYGSSEITVYSTLAIRDSKNKRITL